MGENGEDSLSESAFLHLQLLNLVSWWRVNSVIIDTRCSFREIESDESNYRVHAALLGFDLSSQVRAGENRGRKLRHDFVVLSTRDAVLKKGTAKHTGELRIKPPDAISLSRYAISFWITAMNNPIPIQATGGFVKEKT